MIMQVILVIHLLMRDHVQTRPHAEAQAMLACPAVIPLLLLESLTDPTDPTCWMRAMNARLLELSCGRSDEKIENVH